MKTYSHLLHKKRIPTEYEIVCSNLHYYIAHGGFEVSTPLAKWYSSYQKNSPLKCKDWEQFYDPRETTYSKYINIQYAKEIFVNGVLECIENNEYNGKLSKSWLKVLFQVVFPFRYPGHGFQMIASYIGQMAPSGRITIACTFQAADEIRRIQRFAYRMRQLQLEPKFIQLGLNKDSMDLWQSDPLWQPLRKNVEMLLTTYDWAEAFVGLNLVLKPMIDNLFMVQLGTLSENKGDPLLKEIFFSLNQDCQWHQAWSQALVNILIQDTPANLSVIHHWMNKWYPLARQAVSSFSPIFSRFGVKLRVAEADELRKWLNKTFAA